MSEARARRKPEGVTPASGMSGTSFAAGLTHAVVKKRGLRKDPEPSDRFRRIQTSGETMMNSTDTRQAGKSTEAARAPGTGGPSSTDLHNDRTHDSTVDTDGKNLEAARLAGHSPIGPDEVTTSNASLVNSMPEARDGLAGFDSRVGGNHLLLALEPGYTMVDKGMVAPQSTYDDDQQFDDPGDPRPVESHQEGGRLHFTMNHKRPTRVIELQRVK
jgi:hypothetical protein